MSTVADKILELSTLPPGNTVRDHLISAVRSVNALIDVESVEVSGSSIEVGDIEVSSIIDVGEVEIYHSIT